MFNRNNIQKITTMITTAIPVAAGTVLGNMNYHDKQKCMEILHNAIICEQLDVLYFQIVRIWLPIFFLTGGAIVGYEFGNLVGAILGKFIEGMADNTARILDIGMFRRLEVRSFCKDLRTPDNALTDDQKNIEDTIAQYLKIS